VPEAPRIIMAYPCPVPIAPVLPAINGDALLDEPANVEIIMDRDSRMRRYIDGLLDALDCYASQARED